MSKRVAGVDPDDFSDDESLDMRAVLEGCDLHNSLMQEGGFSYEESVDGMYSAGLPSVLIDQILFETEHKEGSWN